MLSRKLQSSVYEYIPDINPKWTRIQRIQADISGDGFHLNFKATRPIPRALLSAKAWIKWSFRTQKTENGAIADMRTFNQVALFVKPWSLLARCTRLAKLTLNGYGFTQHEPRNWTDYIARMFATQEQLQGYYSTSGGGFPSNDGAYNSTFLNLNQGVIDGVQRTDNIIDENINLAWNNWRNSNFPVARPEADWSYLDYLNIGPFNPFYDMKDDLPDTAWYKHMSNTIPYIHQFELDLELDKIAANTLIFPFSVRVNPGAGVNVVLNDLGVLSAELVLTWIVPQVDSLPFKISIPSWSVNVKSFEINNGAVINDVFQVGTAATVATDIIHYHQIPTFLLIYAGRDKDEASYLCQAHHTADDAGQTNITSFPATNSFEPNMRMSNLRIAVNVNNRVVDTRWSELEIFAVSTSNCKEFTNSRIAFLGGNMQYSTQPGQSFALFRPDDLSIERTTGVLERDFTLQVSSDLLTATGFYKQSPFVGNYTYRLYIISFYAQDMLTFSADRKVEKHTRSRFI